MNKKELGNIGEQMACAYLEKKGYTILERNWTYLKLELDIICSYEKKIVFVEVKTRENDFFGPPWIAVKIGKQKKIIKAASEYMIQNNSDLEAQFDIVSIIYNSKEKRIEHFPEAFYPLV